MKKRELIIACIIGLHTFPITGIGTFAAIGTAAGGSALVGAGLGLSGQRLTQNTKGRKIMQYTMLGLATLVTANFFIITATIFLLLLKMEALYPFL